MVADLRLTGGVQTEENQMLNRLRLWWLELRLESELGKHDAFLNRVYEAKATEDDEKVRIALDVLRLPPLNKGQRWAEHQKLAGRQVGALADEPAAAQPKPKESPRLAGSFRILFLKMTMRASKSATPVTKKAAHNEPVG